MSTSNSREMVVVQAEPISLAVVAIETEPADLAEQIEQSFTVVYAAVSSGKIQQPGQNVIIYRALGSGDINVECGVQVPSRFDGFGQLAYRETPAGRAATTAHYGPYALLGETHAALVTWARNHGLQPTGTFWEVYGDWNDDPQQLRVDIFHQVS
jgi:effector-binding domain-containing protein